jgi:hypothetical protein
LLALKSSPFVPLLGTWKRTELRIEKQGLTKPLGERVILRNAARALEAFAGLRGCSPRFRVDQSAPLNFCATATISSHSKASAKNGPNRPLSK